MEFITNLYDWADALIVVVVAGNYPVVIAGAVAAIVIGAIAIAAHHDS